MKLMKTTHSMFNRRGFIKRGLLFLPAIYLPKFGANPVVVELFNRDGSEVFHLPRSCSGLQAASTIKQRTISSVVDNRVRLINSNFARLWSTDVGTSWTKIRIGCRISIEDSGANLASTPRFYFGVCSGTSNIVMDSTTTHWVGLRTIDPSWVRVAGPPAYYRMDDATSAPTFSKRVSATFTDSTQQGNDVYVYDCTTSNRSVIFLDITKGSPNFTLLMFNRQTTTASDVDSATYLAQLALSSPTIIYHAAGLARTIATDEGANGSFTAVNIGWDRTSPAIELSDVAVVKLA